MERMSRTAGSFSRLPARVVANPSSRTRHVRLVAHRQSKGRFHISGRPLLSAGSPVGTVRSVGVFRHQRLFIHDMASSHPASNPTSLQRAFNPAVYERVRKLWFEKAATDNELMLPPMELAKQWFTSDPAFDELCRNAFGEQLRLIQSGDVTASDLLASTASLKPFDWLGLILLLDQVPRNCYRGPEAKIAFTTFDPIAVEITLRAIKEGIPDTPEIRYHAGYRLWFYLPLQHSEERGIHELSMVEHARIFADMRELMDSSEERLGGDEKLRQCRRFLLENREAVEKWDDMLVGFSRRHKAVIDRFGRYPHRNEALARDSSEEEVRYLAEGGETFSSGR
ncbi:hypothetical protein B0T16DRAFT_407535 [Cercophora newfieldiana]|uniref:Uncharacterized protein n=1 Tax=Cercophora newfieldiana TaxID=92897 RepID=A0AA40CVL1_9PEZI|nr:hypothetical protein B0T16DRAFT_407535 [Cercophora newfieldiana]